MQAAVDPVSQISVDVGSMDYASLMEHGFPFMSVQRVSATDKSSKLRQEVERSCVDEGLPIIIEGWHMHPLWQPKLFTFAYLQEHFGTAPFLCRNLRSASDVAMSMNDYIRKFHPESAEVENEDGHERDLIEIKLEKQADTLEQDQEQKRELELEPESEQERESKRERKSKRELERKHEHRSRNKSEHEEEHEEEEAHVFKEQPPQDIYPTLPSPRSPAKTPQTPQTTQEPDPLYYAKDVTCPGPWRAYLEDTLPSWLAYMSDNDLLANVTGGNAAENLMIYMGTEGTWTPAHIDQCGAIGHNLMAWADDDSRSIWFMISAKDKKNAEKFWRSLGHPLEYEGYFASVEELKTANFPIYVIEQKLGDFVMVPSESYHQVVNMGKATIKVSWNRLTAHSLTAAIKNVLPRYREIFRPESYRIKLIVHETLRSWTDLLCGNRDLPQPVEYFCESFKTILGLFQGIVEDDWVDLDVVFKGKKDQWFSKPSGTADAEPVRCDFCHADIWNRRFHCPDCAEEDDAYEICMYCFAQGRGCEHRAKPLEIVESCSLNSCRLLIATAIMLWNESEKLKGCEKHVQLSDPWENGIVPSKDKGASTATLAYMRLTMLRTEHSERPSCHRCKNKARGPVVWTECKFCPSAFCERCLWDHYNTKWASVVGLKDGWECPLCTKECRCRKCAPEEQQQRDQSDKPHREPVLWFTRPNECAKNRGGVSDNMDRSYNRQYVFKHEDDNDDDDIDEEFGKTKSRKETKRPTKEWTTRHHPKRIRREDPSSSRFEPSTVKPFHLSESLDVADTEMFQLMHDLGLGRALKRMESLQCDDGKYYSDVFQLEAMLQAKGSRYRPALDGLRLDILEKFALRAVDSDNFVRGNGESSSRAQALEGEDSLEEPSLSSQEDEAEKP
ncbi:MAG: hypothetical protein BYD32DRAFT_415844 [Podila humilis]|nr:MAG: hypothetical protein BYD32DRAFT_415844 [Podila humilis]